MHLRPLQEYTFKKYAEKGGYVGGIVAESMMLQPSTGIVLWFILKVTVHKLSVLPVLPILPMLPVLPVLPILPILHLKP